MRSEYKTDIVCLGCAYIGATLGCGWMIWSYSKFGVVGANLLQYIRLLVKTILGGIS